MTDDWHHRIVVIDPRAHRIVWSYGHDGSPGTAPGYLNKPDGLDLLPAVGRVAAQPTARPARRASRTARAVPSARVVGSLPAVLSRASAVALPDGRLVVAGGLVSGSSTDQVLVGAPSGLKPALRLPTAGHDAAAALVGRSVYVFGGGQAVSTDTVVRVDPTARRAVVAAHLDEPLSDLGAGVIGSHVYLVGGYTGSRFASAVLRYDGAGRTSTVARLPAGLRYAGVAALGGTLYVAGGLTTAGETDAVLAVDPVTHTVRRAATLPHPIAYGALVALRGALYLIGGKSASGTPVSTVFRIDPAAGTVTIAGHLPGGLAEPAAVAHGGEIIVVGGEGSRAVLALRPR